MILQHILAALVVAASTSAALTRRGGRTCTFELSHLRTQLPYRICVHTNHDLSDGYIDYGDAHRDFNEPGCEKDRFGNPVGDKESVKCHFPCDVPPPSTTSIPPWNPTPVPEPNKLGPNPKILIVGDSISHGQEGDFTWRYRIWEWFKNNAADTKPEFVGPYTGTQERSKPKEPQPPRLDSDPDLDNSPRTSGGYYQGMPKFQSNHFAVWGRQIAQDIPRIRDVVSKYKPDILLVLLGFNDMGWFDNFIKEARKASPGVKLAIANVPQRSLIGGREDLPLKTTAYNKALPELLKRHDSDLSTTRLVDLADNYDCAPAHCPAGYDGLHPNAYGEYLIAQAFSRTLHNEFGVGKSELQLPTSYPPRPLPVPSNIIAVSEPMGVKVTWDQVYESNSYDVRSRITGASEWTESRAGTNRHDQTFTVKGIKWEFQIRSSYGEPAQGGAKGPWSEIITATADRSTPPPPKDIRTSTSGNSLTISWGAVDGGAPVDRFGVIVWDRDSPGAFIDTRGAKQSPYTFSGLNVGHRYNVWVETWGGPGLGGLPSGGNPVMIGAGAPSAPTGLKAETVNPTTVRLSWHAAAGAAGYKVYTNPDETAQKVGIKPDKKGKLVDGETSWGESFLYPGTWHFDFCVSAVNGQPESTRTCVTPPKISDA
ncbi:hypothetical protein K4F52_007768 [Lecanicillium sp. MT-2017a]|nr:hypothetical protein K4F52_007768 [Lecanicillium sp. MT-2017a]